MNIKITNEPVFRGLDPHTPVRIHRRHLPHWRQDGATYFATFRLGDSIPEQTLLQWQEEDHAWLKAHNIDSPLSDPKYQAAYDALTKESRRDFERRSARRLHIELDTCRGSCLLRKPDIRRILSKALNHFHGKRWNVGDFIIMPNHVHGLFQPLPGTEKSSGPSLPAEQSSAPSFIRPQIDGPEDRPTYYELSSVLGAVKGFVSTRLTQQRAKLGKLWQQENYDRLVRDRKELTVWRSYIMENAAKAGLGDAEYTYQRSAWLDDK